MSLVASALSITGVVLDWEAQHLVQCLLCAILGWERAVWVWVMGRYPELAGTADRGIQEMM